MAIITRTTAKVAKWFKKTVQLETSEPACPADIVQGSVHACGLCSEVRVALD